MKSAGIIIFILIAGLIFPIVSYSQDSAQEKQVKVLRGQISQIDWAASTITVRWLQTEGYVSYDEIILFVPDTATIVRGTETIGLAELDIGNQVTVEYVNTSPGPLKIIKMTVLVP